MDPWRAVILAAALLLTAAGAVVSGEPASSGDGVQTEMDGARVELFEDLSFRRGFCLSFPSSARGRAVQQVIEGADAEARPTWRLCQWATRISLADATPARLADGRICCEDETKRLVFGGDRSGIGDRGPDLVLELRAGAEYRGHARAAGEAWPHLLVEQDAAHTITLDRLTRLDLEIQLRLTAFADRMNGLADPALHAAQFQLFLIVKEVTPSAAGDFLWFGVPLFDSRHEFPPSHRAKDGGKDDATGKLIYTIAGRDVLTSPVGRGEWVAVRKDVLPFIREALVYAVDQRFLATSDPARYAVVNMNLGWEMPGAYDGAAEIRGLAVTAVTAGQQ